MLEAILGNGFDANMFLVNPCQFYRLFLASFMHGNLKIPVSLYLTGFPQTMAINGLTFVRGEKHRPSSHRHAEQKAQARWREINVISKCAV